MTRKAIIMVSLVRQAETEKKEVIKSGILKKVLFHGAGKLRKLLW